MPDTVQQKFVASFVDFLKDQIKAQIMPSEALESVEVAVQCLLAAFEIEEGDEAQSIAQPAEATCPKVDLFEIFQNLYRERNPDNVKLAEELKNEGNRLMKESKYNEALLQYNRAIIYDPKNPILYCNRAAAHIRLNDNERAINDCKTALIYNDKYAKAYGRLGIAYNNLGKYDEAEAAYNKAIELEPDNQDYRNNLDIARSSRRSTQNPQPDMTQLRRGLETMMGNPALRNLFSNVDIDMDQLSAIAQNPAFESMMAQFFPAMRNAATNVNATAGTNTGNNAGGPPLDFGIDIMNLMSQAMNRNQGSNNGAGGGNNSNANQEQQPPSSGSNS